MCCPSPWKPPVRQIPTPCLSSADYATTYARQAATLSGLDVALAVCAKVRPPWLAAVAAEPGVREVERSGAVAMFAAS
jgi:hypothetical protein